MQPLERYEAIVDDGQAFLEAASRPLPKAIWTNTLKAAAQETGAWLLRRCPEAEPLPWLEGAWRVPPETTPGIWPEFLLGLLHAQEEITLLPVLILDPQPGEQVLDLCAAPGNKAGLSATRMGDAGCVMANEARWPRFQGLRDLVDRLGLTSVTLSHADGCSLPGRELFARSLVDAPCSGEGTSRKHSGWIAPTQPGKRQQLAALQTRLLRRALALTEPGGIVVYCTCTYAPEENEAVLSAIGPQEAVIEPLGLPPGLRAEPGLRAWGGQRFREDIGLAARFWPHHNDTGGFFVARLRRL